MPKCPRCCTPGLPGKDFTAKCSLFLDHFTLLQLPDQLAASPGRRLKSHLASSLPALFFLCLMFLPAVISFTPTIIAFSLPLGQEHTSVMENFPLSCTFSPICLQLGWQVFFFSLLKMPLKQRLFNPPSLARHLCQSSPGSADRARTSAGGTGHPTIWWDQVDGGWVRHWVS